MNQIYKVIWSKVRHCCIVVSELGRKEGKSVSSSSRMSKKMAVSLAVMALCAGMNAGVMAADGDTTTSWNFSVSVGPDVKNPNEGTATGSKTEIQPGDTVVLQAGRGIKLTKSTSGKAVQIGLKFIDMQPGGWPYNDAKATGSASLAIGQNSVVDAQQGVAVGWKSHSGEFGFAGGSESDAGLSSVAIGYNAKAALEGSVAIGTGVRIDPSKSDSGYKKVDSTYSVAIGDKAYVGEKSTGSNVIGNLAEVTASEYAVVLGTSAKVNKIANGIAIGYKASVTAGSGDGGVAIGSYSVAKQRAGLAGYDPENKDRSSDEKYGYWKSGLGAVSVGDKGKTRQITQVAAGTYNMDAVNVAQLKALNTKLTADIKAASLVAGNNNITIKKDGDTNKISLADTITLGSDANANNQVKVDGANGQVVIGAADSGIVMGNQEVTLKNADGTDKLDENGDVVKQSGKYITGLSNTTWDADNIVADRAATEGQLKEIIGTEIGKINDSIKNTKQTFVGDSGTKVEIRTTDTLSLTGGADANSLTDKNIGIVNNGKGFKVQLSSNLSGLDSVSTKTLTAGDSVTVGSGDAATVISGNAVTTGSVTTGDTTISSDGLTITDGPSVTKDGIDAGGKAIHNIGEATEATDAINKGTFDTTINNIGSGMNQLGNQINKLDNRVDRVGAGAAALAALHPLDFDPTSRWEFSAGIGNYRGANAVAVGAFYRPNYNTMVSIGSSYGGGENMVNAGVTWRFGEGGTGNYESKGAMAQEINNLRSVVDEQNSKLASQNEKIEAQNSKIEAQSQQLEEQNKKIEQLMQAIAELKK
ncbi:MAG: ESPR-type extended signal peptide-containing protein [Megasphaera massiliensis]|uniref:ESPR-type extended signal peptide-containing protein n=1 Tax=Megasphaera TaxID=906 RepID=UPI001CD58EF0|nr:MULTISPECIES: ESPR-type extended signal peptide-containing protein [Megasphaera]MBS5212215.1 YadA-like family protein [Megasphaera sp.]MCB5735530.1 YadA-like family protein [Megasphaera massiliensis]UBS52768.1 YadA-like family protein [Megasphaera massiliensis]